MSIRRNLASSLKSYNLLPRIETRQSTEHMTLIILIGSFSVNVLLVGLLSISFFILDNTYVLGRIFIGILMLAYLTLVGYFIRKKKVRLSAWMLVGLYGLLGLSILHSWGINAPVGILVLGFVIVLTSVMLGAKQIVTVTLSIIVSLILLQYFSMIGLSQPDRSMLDNNSTYGDVAGYAVIFCIFALIAWLSKRKMEDTLTRAIKAEQTLQEERDALAMRVKEQTKSLRDAQQKELKQLYKFAELGQLTTIILHELANYLSILTLDIDDLEERHQNSVAINHAKESIFYIDTIIEQVRNQIKVSDNTRRFDALATTKESIEQLRKKLSEANLKLFIEDNGSNRYVIYGDPLRLSQAITILVTNAVQAKRTAHHEISIEASSNASYITISVKDFGKGIPETVRKTLFEPQKNTKTAGLGIGLYVTKQIIETHFKGRIWLSPSIEYTQFNIEIPKSKTRSAPSERVHTQNAPTAPSPHTQVASNPAPE